MIAAQSTETDPASNDVTSAPGATAFNKASGGELTVHGQTPAGYEWGCLVRGLWERFEGPAVQKYLASLPVFEGASEGWREVLCPRGKGGDKTRRPALLRRSIKDVNEARPDAPAALVVLQLLLWAELDATFWRLLRMAPRYETLGPDLLGCLKVAVERLPHRLEHAAERGDTDPDLGRELTDLTSYLGDQLLVAHLRDHLEAEVGTPEAPSHESGRNQTEELLGSGEFIAGLFSPVEVARILDEEHLFRFRVAASTSNGRALLRIVRYPIVKGG